MSTSIDQAHNKTRNFVRVASRLFVGKSIVQHVCWYNFTSSYGIVESKPVNQGRLEPYTLHISLVQLTLVSTRVSAPPVVTL